MWGHARRMPCDYRNTLGWCSCMLKTEDCWPPPEVRIVSDGFFPKELIEEAWLCQHLSLLASKTEKLNFWFFNHPVYDTLLCHPWQFFILAVLPYFIFYYSYCYIFYYLCSRSIPTFMCFGAVELTAFMFFRKETCMYLSSSFA